VEGTHWKTHVVGYLIFLKKGDRYTQGAFAGAHASRNIAIKKTRDLWVPPAPDSPNAAAAFPAQTIGGGENIYIEDVGKSEAIHTFMQISSKL